MTEVEYSAEIVGDMLFQNVEGGEAHIVGARFDSDRRVVVLSIAGSAVPDPTSVRAVARREGDKIFTRFVAD